MSEDIRTTGFAPADSMATAIFGGLTPAISTYLIRSRERAIPGVWLSFGVVRPDGCDHGGEAGKK